MTEPSGVNRSVVLWLLFTVALLLTLVSVPAKASAAATAPMSYISFIGDSTYSGVSSISWVYKLHERLDSRHTADSYYAGDGMDNRLTGTHWTFYNAAYAGKTLFELYDGTDDYSGVWGEGSNLKSTVISTFIPGTQHWVFIGGGLNDVGRTPTKAYADKVLTLRFQIEADVRAAGMIPIQCTLTPWGCNQGPPFSTQPNLAHDLVDYFNVGLKKHCATTATQVQDFYTPLANSVRDSVYWVDYYCPIGRKIHFTPKGKTVMANSVNIDVLGLSTSLTISTPIAPYSVYAGRSLPVRGYMAHHIAVPGDTVRLYKWRLVSGHYKSYGYMTMKVSEYYGHSRYARTISLPHKGTWRIRAYHVADATDGALWSPTYRTVHVR